ncbi:hypothetical protein [Shewanella gaetbuli]|uniref:Tetratricopeptide repeat protein n=1 Tax=Shewanella gaetbuli TaxID=220752 RepID=A0A9X1ZI17_9GAMM|nr:hypothetical protein [Shewanella gaetbuli]MCL1142118.1 hypothetical protein [Shewanella gaetbuli]
MTKSNLSKLIATSLLALTATSASADVIETSPYKMVVIENTPGVDALQSGNVSEGVAITRAASKHEIDSYTRNLNLCVGYTRLSKLDEAKKACTDAVKTARYAIAAPDVDLKAYAYNNRAVMKLLANDNLGALEDFRKAAKVSDEAIYSDNLSRLESAINATETGV